MPSDARECPFCGCADEAQIEFVNSTIWCFRRCTQCGAAGPREHAGHGGDTLAAWNRRAALDAQGAQWRDIESDPPPKDGTKFWAWPCHFNDGPAVVTAYWYVHPAVQGWITDELDCGDYEFEPTHWQPLVPAAPPSTGSAPDA